MLTNQKLKVKTMYDSSEIFWKNLYTIEDMKSRIVWNAKTDEDFNKTTKTDCDRIIKALQLDKSEPQLVVVDFGCGIGRLVKHLATNTNHLFGGVDVSQPMINQAKEYCKDTKARFVHMMNGVSIPCEDNFADAIYSHIVLQHIHKYKVFFILHEFKRVLKSGGLAFIQLPNLLKNAHDYANYAKDYVNFDQVQISAMHFWTIEEARFVLSLVGFEVVEVFEERTDFFVLFKKPEVKE